MEWFRSANRKPAEEAVPSVVKLVQPPLEEAQPQVKFGKN